MTAPAPSFDAIDDLLSAIMTDDARERWWNTPASAGRTPLECLDSPADLRLIMLSLEQQLQSRRVDECAPARRRVSVWLGAY